MSPINGDTGGVAILDETEVGEKTCGITLGLDTVILDNLFLVNLD